MRRLAPSSAVVPIFQTKISPYILKSKLRIRFQFHPLPGYLFSLASGQRALCKAKEDIPLLYANKGKLGFNVRAAAVGWWRAGRGPSGGASVNVQINYVVALV